MYSSGVTLQAMGVKVKRYQAVLIDCFLAFLVTLFAVFNSSFHTYLVDFVDLVIVWIAPWLAIFLVDWAMRKFRYVPRELQRTDRGGLYYANGGFRLAGHDRSIGRHVRGHLSARDHVPPPAMAEPGDVCDA